MSVHIATRKVIKDWIDYNGHMNMAYYVLIFDQAWENILNKFEMGGEKAKETKRTTMVVETRTTYDSCLLYTSPSPRDRTRSRMPSSA